jgi:hypothetical protein
MIVSNEQELDALIAEIQNPTQFQVTITDADRQMIMLGLSRLAMERPGWEYALRDIAVKFDAEKMLQEFKATYIPGRLPVAVPENDCPDEIKEALCLHADRDKNL